jgi:hypothetical protein
MNLQRITNDAWSFYLLKYALKVSGKDSEFT